jgi:hypothetical protein
MFDDEYDEQEEQLSYYIEIGAVDIAGIEEDGQFIYQINESAKDLAPELWQAHNDHIDSSLLKLFEEGMIEISYNEDLEVSIKLTEEGEILAKSMGLVELGAEDPGIPNN